MEKGGERRLHRQIFRRALILFALGMLPRLLFDLDFSNLRFAGVLQRISLVYLATAHFVLHLSRRTQVGTAAGLLLGYWAAAMTLLPVPGAGASASAGAGVLTPEGNIAAYIDSYLLWCFGG